MISYNVSQKPRVVGSLCTFMLLHLVTKKTRVHKEAREAQFNLWPMDLLTALTSQQPLSIVPRTGFPTQSAYKSHLAHSIILVGFRVGMSMSILKLEILVLISRGIINSKPYKVI